jgi:hypothetical protein
MTTTTIAAQDEVDRQARIGHRPWQEAVRHAIARDRREEDLGVAGAAEEDEAVMATGQGHFRDQGAGRHAAAPRGHRTADLLRGRRHRGADMEGASHHHQEADAVEAVAGEVEAEADEARVTARMAAEVRETVAGVGIADREPSRTASLHVEKSFLATVASPP